MHRTPTYRYDLPRVTPKMSHGATVMYVHLPVPYPGSVLSVPSQMDFRSGGSSSGSRMSSASHMNSVPILPVSNERTSGGNSTMGAPRPGSLNMSTMVNNSTSSGISMPLSLPVPMIGQPQKRPRLEPPVAPPPGMSFPYRLNVDLNTYPPTAHATSLSQQSSPQHQRPPQGDLSSFTFPTSNANAGMGIQSDGFGPTQGAFEFPSTRRSIGGYPTPQSASSYSGNSMSSMFGARPGPQTTNMLLDLLSSTSGNDGVSPFEWPSSPTQGSQLDGTSP